LEDELDHMVETRRMTPGRLFLRLCDGKLTDEDFNDEGNAFAQAYFEDVGHGYIADYQKYLGLDDVANHLML
jgi:hypothetical protein